MLICSGAGATAPSNLMAQQNGVGSILVSWTLPSLRPVGGYQISTQSPPDFSAGIDVGHDVSSRTIPIAPGMHPISIRARSQHYPGMVVLVPVTVRGKGEIYDFIIIFLLRIYIIQHLKGRLL